MKVESIEEYLERGGKIKKPKYEDAYKKKFKYSGNGKPYKKYTKDEAIAFYKNIKK